MFSTHSEPVHSSIQLPYSYGVAIQSPVPIRREPKEQSEMVSQLLFGEYYKVVSNNGSWIKINTLFDNYSGWIDLALFRGVNETEYENAVSGPRIVVDAVFAKISAPGQPPMLIPAGSELPGFDEKSGAFSVAGASYTIQYPFERMYRASPNRLTEMAIRFLNSPYLWGGRSPVGFDCSGFIQVVFKMAGVRLPRDAYQQATMGEEVGSVTDLRNGDLGFFCNDKGQIKHVGLATGAGKIIHCSGFVRIDMLDETGIFNDDTRQYTHKLCRLRRLPET